MRSLNQKQLRGPGIAVVGYLGTAISALLMVFASKLGEAMSLHPWIYSPPVLLGALGVFAGFALGGIGIIATWMSFGSPNLKLDWLARLLEFPHLDVAARLWKPVLWVACIATAPSFKRMLERAMCQSLEDSLLSAAVFLRLDVVAVPEISLPDHNHLPWTVICAPR